MAFSIFINKIEECDLYAYYEYLSDGKRGTLRIEKSTGAIELLEKMVGDESETIFLRAQIVIYRAWKTGTYPDHTQYAA
jgi:hypothetical protein